MPKTIVTNDVTDAIDLVEWATNEGKPAEVLEHLKALAAQLREEFDRQNSRPYVYPTRRPRV